MGQRHQLFVIANIGGRYRTLAVVHHQWLNGDGPLRRCLRFMQIFQAGSNRIPLKQEFRAAEDKSDEFWTGNDFQPFPFVATSLLIGSSFDPCKGYQSRVHLLAFNTTPDQVDNNDGITIVDISNPKYVQYSFAFLHGWEEGVKPLSAMAYMCHYIAPYNHTIDDDELSLSKRLEHKKIPQEYRMLTQQFESQRMIQAESLRNWLNQDTDHNVNPLSEEAMTAYPKLALRDQAMDALLETALKDPDYDPSNLAEAQLLPDFVSKLRNKMLSLAKADKLPTSPNIVHYLEIAFGEEVNVDLSPFTNSPAEHLVEAALVLLKSGVVKSLDLSHLGNLTQTHVEDINLESGLEILYLLDMPQISLSCVASLWSQNSALKDIYHTELFCRPLVKKFRYSRLLSLLQNPSISDTQNPIKNILWARVLAGERVGKHNFKADGVKVDWQRLEHAPSVLDHEDTMGFYTFPVCDLLLPPTKLVNGLVNFIECVINGGVSCDIGESTDAGFAMTKAFVSSSSCIRGSSTAIGTLPELLFQASSTAAKVVTTSWPLPFPDLRVGELSIVIINEHDPCLHGLDIGLVQNKFQIAVVSPISEDKSRGYHVQDMEAYLMNLPKHVQVAGNGDLAELVQYCQEKMHFVGSCESEEIQDLLFAVERNVAASREGRAWTLTTRGWDYAY
ncbi:MAG: hypothetical protein Q9209_005715 [Squamulea sp. 1 TL-2023]